MICGRAWKVRLIQLGPREGTTETKTTRDWKPKSPSWATISGLATGRTGADLQAREQGARRGLLGWEYEVSFPAAGRIMGSVGKLPPHGAFRTPRNPSSIGSARTVDMIKEGSFRPFQSPLTWYTSKTGYI